MIKFWESFVNIKSKLIYVISMTNKKYHENVLCMLGSHRCKLLCINQSNIQSISHWVVQSVRQVSKEAIYIGVYGIIRFKRTKNRFTWKTFHRNVKPLHTFRPFPCHEDRKLTIIITIVIMTITPIWRISENYQLYDN